jgi:hypothetical protein
MGNSFNVTDLVTREVLRVAHEKLSFIGTIDRQYDKSFAANGAKNGDSLRVQKPNQYLRRQGSRVMDVQDQDEETSTITIATQDGVDMRFNSAELSLITPDSIDEFSKKYIEPAVSILASGIESDFLTFATKLVYQQVGTAGTPPTDLAAIGAARAKLNQQLAPKDGNRFVQMDSVTMGGLVNGLKGLFQDSNQIKEQYREGMIGRTGMADWYENERMYAHTNGSSDNAGTVNDTVVSGDTAVTLASMGVSKTITAGSIITFAGCYDVNPETKAAYAHLKQFVITANTETSGAEAVTVSISPAIITTGARKNCSAVPTNGGAALITGAASTDYTQNLMYHKEAFQFVTADLPLMADAAKCVRRNQDGLSMRVWQGSDIRNDELLMRIDILYGMAALRPEWACRITN